MAHAWKACWVHALASSNLASSAFLCPEGGNIEDKFHLPILGSDETFKTSIYYSREYQSSGIVFECSCDEKGELTTDETLYDNGTGRIVFDYDAGTLTWTDDQDHIADDRVFGFVPVSAAETEGEQFLGRWVCGRAVIEVTEADGDMPYNVMITWSNTAAEHTEWVYDCYYDGEALVSNETGTKTTIVFNEKGEVTSSDEAFNDGAVRLSVNDKGMLVWEEFKEDAGKDMEFEKID